MKTVSDAILEITERIGKLTIALDVLKQMEVSQAVLKQPEQPVAVGLAAQINGRSHLAGDDMNRNKSPKRIGRPPKSAGGLLDRVTEALTDGAMIVPELVAATGIDNKGISNCLQRLKAADLAQKVGEGKGCKWDLIQPREAKGGRLGEASLPDYEAQKAALGIDVKKKNQDD